MDFQTPDWVTHRMCDLVEGSPASILEPTPGEGKMVKVLQNRFPDSLVLYPKTDYWTFRENGPQFKPDLIIANPPFSPMKEGYRFLFDFMAITDRVISIMPWYVNQSVRRTKSILQYGMKRMVFLPRSVFRNCRTNCCVLDLQRGYRGTVEWVYWETPCTARPLL